MMNEKKMSYRQLEKQNRLGKELIMRVTKQLSASKEESRALMAQLQVSEAILAILIAENGRESVTITKELIQDVLSTKKVSWRETEGKDLQLFLQEVEINETNDTASEGASQDGEDNNSRSSETSGEATEVQEQESGSGRNNIPQPERSKKVYRAKDTSKIRKNSRANPTT